MPSRDDIARITYYHTIDQQRWICWNAELEVWEPIAEAKWYECGAIVGENRLCTKFIGHRGKHGQRDPNL